MFEPIDIYLDHAAATAKRPEVAALHEQRCARFFANPHGAGRHSTDCRLAAEKAAAEMLDLLEIPADDACLYWTSGGTEAANLAIQGACRRLSRPRVAVAATAHACLLEPAERAAGSQSWRIAVDSEGQIAYDRWPANAGKSLGLTALCHVNNETGVCHDLSRLRSHLDAVGAAGGLLLVDALQSAGKMSIPWRQARIDMLMIGGRKLGGPAGLGALIVRRGISLAPLLVGGGQQDGVRPGTVDVVAALELAHALRLSVVNREKDRRHVTALNAHLRERLRGLPHCPGRIVSPANASPWILCAVFEGYEGAILTRYLGGHGIAVGAGSACSAESKETSHVLRAMGIPAQAARGMMRISLGYNTAHDDIDRFAEELAQVLKEY